MEKILKVSYVPFWSFLLTFYILYEIFSEIKINTKVALIGVIQLVGCHHRTKPGVAGLISQSRHMPGL